MIISFKISFMFSGVFSLFSSKIFSILSPQISILFIAPYSRAFVIDLPMSVLRQRSRSFILSSVMFLFSIVFFV